MTEQSNEKLLDRIRKLHAMAESSKKLGNEAEAAAFAGKVQELLEAHKLEMSVLEYEAQDQDEPIGHEYIDTSPTGHKKQRVAWRESLAMAVAHAHYCRILVIPGSSKVMLVGRPIDRQVATYMIHTLTGLAEVMADSAYVAYFYKMKALGDVRRARGFRPAFLIGFVNTIRQRYREEAEALKAKARTNGMSLIRLDQEHEKVVKYTTAFSSGRLASGLNQSTSNAAGYHAGSKAGNDVRIRGTGLGAGKSTTHDRLSRGQSLLGGGQ